MKKTLIILILSFVAGVFLFSATARDSSFLKTNGHSPDKEIRSGDLIFQTLNSPLSNAIQLATHSKYSHVGIVFERNGRFYVYEAVQPVKFTPLKAWIARGIDQHYVIKRLKNADKILNEEIIAKMLHYGQQFEGSDYDSYFEWTDNRLYCSELVWKIYKEVTDLEIGTLARLSSFDLTHPLVIQQLKQHYGDRIPMDEKIISPQAMFESKKLITISENEL